MKSNGLKEEHRRDFVGGSDAPDHFNSNRNAQGRSGVSRALDVAFAQPRLTCDRVEPSGKSAGSYGTGNGLASLMRFQIGAHGARRSAPEGYCQPTTDCAVSARHRVGVGERDRQIFRRS